ncbi:MAG: cell envelope integrity protein TolA [Woeseiaceae bacterium]
MNLWDTIKNNPQALIWALLFHLAAFMVIGVSFSSSEPNINEAKAVKVIEAVAIDESQIKAEINKLKKADNKKKRDQKRLQDKAKLAKQNRKREERKLRALKKKQKEQQRANKKKQIQQNKRLAALEKKRILQERKQKEAQEKINKLENIRKEKIAQLKKEEQARINKISEKNRLAKQQQRAKYEQGEVAKFEGLIKNRITQNWIFPVSYQKGMKCKVLVRLIPSGDVVSVRITQSSGNSAFDRSVEMAVNKASPLPVPTPSSGLFSYFREVELVFDPNT